MRPPQPQRGGRQRQLLLREPHRRPPRVERPEHRREPLQVHGPPVVRIDERCPGHLGALVDVGDAGHGELQQLGREHRATDGRRHLGDPLVEPGDDLGVRQQPGRVLHQRVLPDGVRSRPRGPRLLLARRLDQVRGEPLGLDRPVRCPGPGERLPEQVLGAPVEIGRPHVRRRLPQPPHQPGPGLRVGGHGPDPRPHVLAALRVVGGPGGHGRGPRLGGVPRVRVQLVRPDAEPRRRAAHLAQADQVGPPVVRGVLHALGHDGAAHLREPDHELGTPLLVPPPRGPGLATEHQVDHEVQRVVPVGVEARPGDVRRLPHHALCLRRCGLPGDDVRAVPAERNDQLDHAVLQGPERVVAQPHVLAADVREHGGQQVDLRVQRGLDDLPLGLLDHVVQPCLLARHLVHQPGERGGAVGVHLQGVQPPRRVVARGPGDGPVVGQGLVLLEDLLGHDPRPAGRLVQAPQVAARVGEPVGVVDPEAVDHARMEELEQQRVRGVEDVVVLHADARKRADVEEAPVVQLLVGDAPVREPVVLPPHELGQWQVLRLGPHGEQVVVVAQHGLLLVALPGHDGAVQHELPRREHGADPRAQHRHEEPLPRGDVEVEPVRVGGLVTVLERGPQGAVVPGRRRHGHVVRHHVDDDAHPARVRRRGEPFEAVPPAHDVADPGVVHDVVPVRGTGRGLQHGREVEVRDPEGVEVRERLLGVRERQFRTELEAIRADRGAAAGSREMGMHCASVARWGLGRPARFTRWLIPVHIARPPG